MRPHEKVQKLLSRVEPVEWLYDGLNGKIIPWTKEHGGTSDDPSVQAFLVGWDGEVIARCPDAQAHGATGFAEWLADQLRAFEKSHPRTAVPFVPADVEAPEGEPARCAALAEARAAKKPVLVYVGRDGREDDDRMAKAQTKRARSFEKATLGSKKAAAAAEGWVLLRLDLGDAAQARLAAQLGVKEAPALLALLPGAEGPQDLRLPAAGSLAYFLQKNAAAAEDR